MFAPVISPVRAARRAAIVAAMKPITVSVDVARPREDVFAFLDVLRNHERFNDHLLSGWEYTGPERGVGSTATVRTKVAGRTRRAGDRDRVQHAAGRDRRA